MFINGIHRTDCTVSSVGFNCNHLYAIISNGKGVKGIFINHGPGRWGITANPGIEFTKW